MSQKISTIVKKTTEWLDSKGHDDAKTVATQILSTATGIDTSKVSRSQEELTDSQLSKVREFMVSAMTKYQRKVTGFVTGPRSLAHPETILNEVRNWMEDSGVRVIRTTNQNGCNMVLTQNIEGVVETPVDWEGNDRGAAYRAMESTVPHCGHALVFVPDTSDRDYNSCIAAINFAKQNGLQITKVSCSQVVTQDDLPF